MCTRYHQRGINERAKLNDVAPRDVKQLELLKPIHTPSMGTRYKESLEKEKRLEAASRPLQKAAQQAKETGTEEPREKNSKKRKRSNKRGGEADAPNVSYVPKDALEQEDEVREGVDWSDDDK